MDLMELFKTQKVLDERIVKEKGLEGQDLLDKKILALQVELGELANEWRRFKFWKENPQPRTEHDCEICEGEGTIELLTESINDGKGERVTFIDCRYCNGDGYLDRNPLLEEYVDCLHFFLSTGNDLKINEHQVFLPTGALDIITVFAKINRRVSELWWECHDNTSEKALKWFYAFSDFLRLGKQLGFNWKQIEQAYYEKNEINHQRQEAGY